MFCNIFCNCFILHAITVLRSGIVHPGLSRGLEFCGLGIESSVVFTSPPLYAISSFAPHRKCSGNAADRGWRWFPVNADKERLNALCRLYTERLHVSSSIEPRHSLDWRTWFINLGRTFDVDGTLSQYHRPHIKRSWERNSDAPCVAVFKIPRCYIFGSINTVQSPDTVLDSIGHWNFSDSVVMLTEFLHVFFYAYVTSSIETCLSEWNADMNRTVTCCAPYKTVVCVGRKALSKVFATNLV